MSKLDPNSWNSSPKNRIEQKSQMICKECGCKCESCVDINNIHLHEEIQELKDRLQEKDNQIVTMESQILSHANEYPQGEMQAMRESLYFWQDKYERLLENYRKLQKVNQGLEDKLLRIADKFENDKISLVQNVAELSTKLNEAQLSIAGLQQESEQYKNDCNLAIRMLQNKPSQFVSHKLDSLPSYVQEQVAQHFNFNQSSDELETTKIEKKTVVPMIMPTFPPTAVMYSLNKNETQVEEPAATTNNYVSAATMATILEDRERGRLNGYNSNNYTQLNHPHDSYIPMDGSLPSKSQPNYTRGPESNTLQANSQPTWRGTPSRSIQNETIII